MTNPIFIAVCALALACEPLCAQSPESLGRLRLAGGDFLPGKLADSSVAVDVAIDKPRLAWQYPEFSQPLEFELGSIVSASFPALEQTEPAPGAFAIEMLGGDRLFGRIIELDDWALQVETKRLGVLTILRTAVKRISRWDDGKAILFLGPGTVPNWEIPGEVDAWQSGGSGLRSDRPQAAAFRDIGLPNTARIEIELSWEGKPNFVLAIGVSKENTDESNENAFRVEVWDDEIVLLRELTEVADVIPLGKLVELDGSLRFTLELHQNDGRVIARSEQEKTLGEFALPANDSPDVQPGVRLTNLSGNVSLDALTVMHVGVGKPSDSSERDDTLFLQDRSIRTGQWTAVGGGEWKFLENGSTITIDSEHVLSLNLASSVQRSCSFATRQIPLLSDNTLPLQEKGNKEAGNAEKKDVGEPETPAQIVTHGGVRLSGSVQTIQNGKLIWKSPMIAEPVAIDCDQISRLSVAVQQPPETTNSAYILGRLHFPGGRLTGQFVDTEGETEPTPLRFAPRGARSVHLTPGFTGRMVYRETPPPETAQQRRVRLQRKAGQQRGAQQGGVWNALVRAFGNNSDTKSVTSAARSIHLRSGEVIPCEVETIDEQGIVFASEMTSETRLPQDQVRAITFTTDCRAPEIEAARKDRLLTVPRIRKKNRPTHLIVASNGDLLRCRLIRLDNDSLVVQTRLEKITIKRSLIAQIIWLKDNSRDPASEQAKHQQPATELAVRAVLRSRNRMSLIATSIQDSVLIGEHPLLGESRLKLGDVNELLIGIDMTDPGADQPYSGWRLVDAPEPIIPDPGADGGAVSGKTSPLVGEPAPDFTLDRLDGTPFRVSDQRGTVLVLDFWATWCGPCLQAMPVIEKTVGEFDEKEVRLVAVNLQETAEPIRATLARLNISPEVALDMDGVAAARYQANAIPQTVVIGRDGEITHLFVGGGPQLADSLRQAITETLQRTSHEGTREQ